MALLRWLETQVAYMTDAQLVAAIVVALFAAATGFLAALVACWIRSRRNKRALRETLDAVGRMDLTDLADAVLEKRLVIQDDFKAFAAKIDSAVADIDPEDDDAYSALEQLNQDLKTISKSGRK